MLTRGKNLKFAFPQSKEIIASIIKSTKAKCGSFRVLHTCTKHQQPRGNNRRVTGGNF